MPAALAAETELLAPGHLEAPDLSLRVELAPDPEAKVGQCLRFELTARDPALELNGKPFGPVRLATDPQAYLERVFSKIGLPDRQASDEMEKLGADLAKDLLPEDLNQLLWELQGKVETLWIQSEELRIPWEILKLRAKSGGRWKVGAFLCEAFAVARWTLAKPWWGHLPLGRLALVLAKSPDLTTLGEEQKLVEELRGPEREVEVLPPDREEILCAMETRGFDGWHFAGHGEWRQGFLRNTGIVLQGKEELRPDDVEHGAPNFGATRPFVFLNACHQGRESQGLVHWQGWAARLTAMGAGAFIGASWATKDRAALEFATAFYRSFLGGAPLAEAVRQARLAIREAFPESTTWLAYTVFGYPTAICARPPAGAHPTETVAIERAPEPPKVLVRKPARRLRPRLLWAGVSAILSLALFLTLAWWRMPTRIRLEVPVEKLALTVAGAEAQPLLDASLALDDVTLDGFARLEVPAAGLVLVGRDAGAQASLAQRAPGGPEAAVARLERLWVSPGQHVSLGATREGARFVVQLRLSAAERLGLTLLQPFELRADLVDVPALGTGSPSPSVFAGEPSPADASLTVFPGSGDLGLAAGLSAPADGAPLLSRGLLISALDLLAQDSDGEPLTTVLGAGQIDFPDQPWKSRVAIAASDFVVVTPHEELALSRIELDRESGGLGIVAEGMAREVRTGPRGAGRDHRVSLYERWLRSELGSSLAAWVAGFAALALGLEELWRRLIVGER